MINGYFLHKRLPENSVIFRVDAYVKITGNHLYLQVSLMLTKDVLRLTLDEKSEVEGVQEVQDIYFKNLNAKHKRPSVPL